MKKILIALSLIFFSQVSSATSVMPVVLHLEVAPYRFGPMVSSKKQEVVSVGVAANGDVFGQTCKGRRCDNTEITQLDEYEMKHIFSLIKRARLGQVLDPNAGGVHCLAIPTETFTYTADSGRVLLEKSSRPCGGHVINDTVAAQELVKMLNQFLNEYQH